MVSFDVFYYRSKTKLTSAQLPSRVHSCAAPRPPGREESRVRRPARSVSPQPERVPCPPPNLPAPGRGREQRHLAGMLLAREIPERLSGKVLPAAVPRGASPGRLPDRPAGLRRRPGAQAVPALPGSFCATVARRRWDAVISIHGRCIFFNATSLFQLVADSRIRFPMLFAFPVLWRIKIFVFIQSVPGRVN